MTQADYEAVGYIERVGYVEVEVLTRKFYDSKRQAQRHLKTLTEKGLIKREKLYRNNILMGYIYMMPGTRKTSQLEHLSYCARLVPYLEDKDMKVLNVQYEVTLSKREGLIQGIRCDAVLEVLCDDKKQYFIVECERCHTNIEIKLSAYKEYYRYRKYEKLFDDHKPYLVLITDNKVPEHSLGNKLIVLPLNFFRGK